MVEGLKFWNRYSILWNSATRTLDVHQIAKTEQVLQSLYLELVLDRDECLDDRQVSANQVTVAV